MNQPAPNERAGRPTSNPSSARLDTDAPFLACLAILGGFYLLLIVAMLAADVHYLAQKGFEEPAHSAAARISELWKVFFGESLAKPEIRYSIVLSLLTCSTTAILSLWVAVPLGYLMSRYEFRGKGLADAVLDIPIVLPPLVIGLSLLILFQTPPGRALNRVFPVTYQIPSVVLAQFSVACAFAVRTMRVTFDQLNPRAEQVALTLGCSRSQAFWLVVLPEARRGMITAATLAWARSLGEFGPILVFSGSTRMRTEVLSTTVFLELSVGELEAAVAVSLLMVITAMVVLVVVRVFGFDPASSKVGPK
jgi:molybdate transport system permease protein